VTGLEKRIQDLVLKAKTTPKLTTVRDVNQLIYCPICGKEKNRDLNGAENIRLKAYSLLKGIALHKVWQRSGKKTNEEGEVFYQALCSEAQLGQPSVVAPEVHVLVVDEAEDADEEQKQDESDSEQDNG
jgi:hypothetical protein